MFQNKPQGKKHDTSTESFIFKMDNSVLSHPENDRAEKSNILLKKRHVEALYECLTGQRHGNLNEKCVPVQTWTVYWITQSLSLLKQPQLIEVVTEDVIDFIKECEHRDGGYGGGPGQIAHLATSYAAVNALITTSSESALESIDRINLVRFLHRMKQPDGSFAMHDDGEIDSRASYCALSLLRCLNIQDSLLLDNVTDWILACQTYEGGFGSVPGSEAHGGYTFCCVASLCLMNQLHRADLKALVRWLTNKQLTDDGGFCGRSNKLVDSCYSFWQGAIFPLIYPQLKKLSVFSEPTTSNDKSRKEENVNRNNTRKEYYDEAQSTRPTTRSTSIQQRTNNTTKPKFNEANCSTKSPLDEWLFDCAALQDYVLNQCQSRTGLLKDKPGVSPDYYHTCYALSGLSISQHQPDGSLFDIGSDGLSNNQLAPTHPLFNLTLSNLNHCLDYFQNKKVETFVGEKGS